MPWDAIVRTTLRALHYTWHQSQMQRRRSALDVFCNMAEESAQAPDRAAVGSYPRLWDSMGTEAGLLLVSLCKLSWALGTHMLAICLEERAGR